MRSCTINAFGLFKELIAVLCFPGIHRHCKNKIPNGTNSNVKKTHTWYSFLIISRQAKQMQPRGWKVLLIVIAAKRTKKNMIQGNRRWRWKFSLRFFFKSGKQEGRPQGRTKVKHFSIGLNVITNSFSREIKRDTTTSLKLLKARYQRGRLLRKSEWNLKKII